MKTIKVFTSSLLLSALVLLSFSFASNDISGVPSGNSKVQNACTVSGPDDYMCGWLDEMQTAIQCCKESLSDLGARCQYWGETYSYASTVFSFPTLVQKDAAYVNNWLSVMSTWADVFPQRPNPSGNWMIYDISLSATTCNAGYCCMQLEVTYRKIICTRRE